MNQRQDADGVCSGLLCLWVVALVAPVDQLSPGAGLVVPHHLTIALLMRTLILTLGRTRKFIPPPWYKGEEEGGGGWMEPVLEFLICWSIPKRFYLQWKAFDLLYKIRYILWVVALLGACDVTNNGRHLGRHLGFYQGSESRLTQRQIVNFCLTWKNNS